MGLFVLSFIVGKFTRKSDASDVGAGSDNYNKIHGDHALFDNYGKIRSSLKSD
jgi:hypothetical protein